jgi:hypothetical protein
MNYHSMGMNPIPGSSNRIPRQIKGDLTLYHFIYILTKEVSCICMKN